MAEALVAWRLLSEERRAVLLAAEELVQLVALETAASVAQHLRKEQLASRPCARRVERDLLEQAAKELQLLVRHTASSPHALDGQIPQCIDSERGRIGIEVKSGATTIATDEVDKFRNDLAQGPYAAGLLLSPYAPIAKVPRGLHVQSEITLLGARPAIFVSPPAPNDVMPQLTRNALSLAVALARDGGDRRSLLADVLHQEADALGLARKRLREDEDAHRRRFERASDAIHAVQCRLAVSASNLGAR
jgi:hypothetical protein